MNAGVKRSTFQGVDNSVAVEGVAEADGIIGRRRHKQKLLYHVCWGHGKPAFKKIPELKRERWVPVAQLLQSRRGCGLVHEYEYQVQKAHWAVGHTLVLPIPAAQSLEEIAAEHAEEIAEQVAEVHKLEEEHFKRQQLKAVMRIQTLVRGWATRIRHEKRLRNPIKFVVVLGGLGSGKTTMCKKLCDEYYQNDVESVWKRRRSPSQKRSSSRIRMQSQSEESEIGGTDQYDVTVAASTGNAVAHISAGALLRDTVKKRGRHWLQIDTTMRDGELVPDTIICSCIATAITPFRYNHEGGVVLLDGFPMSEHQADMLDMLGPVKAVFSLSVPIDVMLVRSSANTDSRPEGANEGVLTHAARIQTAKLKPVVAKYLGEKLLCEIDASENQEKTYFKFQQAYVDMLRPAWHSKLELRLTIPPPTIAAKMMTAVPVVLTPVKSDSHPEPEPNVDAEVQNAPKSPEYYQSLTAELEAAASPHQSGQVPEAAPQSVSQPEPEPMASQSGDGARLTKPEAVAIGHFVHEAKEASHTATEVADEEAFDYDSLAGSGYLGLQSTFYLTATGEHEEKNAASQIQAMARGRAARMKYGGGADGATQPVSTTPVDTALIVVPTSATVQPGAEAEAPPETTAELETVANGEPIAAPEPTAEPVAEPETVAEEAVAKDSVAKEGVAEPEPELEVARLELVAAEESVVKEAVTTENVATENMAAAVAAPEQEQEPASKVEIDSASTPAIAMGNMDVTASEPQPQTPHMEPEPEPVGRYVLGTKLGAGAYAEVFLATATNGSGEFAAKVYKKARMRKKRMGWGKPTMLQVTEPLQNN